MLLPVAIQLVLSAPVPTWDAPSHLPRWVQPGPIAAERVPSRTNVAGWHVLARLQDPRIDEASGIVASRTMPGTWWVHNDSGDGPRVFAIGLDGATRAEVRLRGRIALDWEDIAVGPGSDGRSMVYVADTGDNYRIRPSVNLYRFPEPTLVADGSIDAERIAVQYADGRPHDVETMLVDPVSGDLLLVTKERSGERPRLFGVPRASLRDGATVTAALLGTLPEEVALANGGDVSRDGSTIVVRSYSSAWLWHRTPGESLAAAMARPATRIEAPDASEAIAFDPDGTTLVSVPEGVNAPISRRTVPRFAR